MAHRNNPCAITHIHTMRIRCDRVAFRYNISRKGDRARSHPNRNYVIVDMPSPLNVCMDFVETKNYLFLEAEVEYECQKESDWLSQ